LSLRFARSNLLANWEIAAGHDPHNDIIKIKEQKPKYQRWITLARRPPHGTSRCPPVFPWNGAFRPALQGFSKLRQFGRAFYQKHSVPGTSEPFVAGDV